MQFSLARYRHQSPRRRRRLLNLIIDIQSIGAVHRNVSALSPFFERLSWVQILQDTDCADLIFYDDRLYTKIPENAYFYQAQDGPYSHVEIIIFEAGRFHCMPLGFGGS